MINQSIFGSCLIAVVIVTGISSDLTNYPVRLWGGRDNSSGRLEININGVWGTVCGDGFGIEEANVVCRQLGFTKYPGNVYFPRQTLTTNPILLDGLRCLGNESHLAACSHNPIGRHDCTHGEDIHVNCSSQPELALVRGVDERRGRLVIATENIRGSVCADGFNLNAASVVCRQLGFTGAPVKLMTTKHYSSRITRWFQDVRCFGNESLLWDCAHSSWGSNNCNNSDYVAIECLMADDYTLRLRDGVNSSGNGANGRLEIKLGGQFYELCGSINQKGAELACQQMGYPSKNVRMFHREYFLPASPRVVHVYDVHCDMDTNTFKQCDMKSSLICRWVVGIICTDQPDYQVRLAGGYNNDEGRLEVKIGGIWGTICNEGFGQREAKVVCRMLGYPTRNAQTVAIGQYSKAPKDTITWFNHLTCNGSEESLENCNHSDSNSCDLYFDDVAVSCLKSPDTPEYSVRLVGGTGTPLRHGKVEVYINGQWRTVCSNSFDDNAAQVVCRQLGYSGRASYHSDTYTGSSTRPIPLENLRCGGHENSLKDCDHNAVGIHDCYQDVAVVCGSREDTPEYSVRLVGGNHTLFRYYGRVEVYINGQWRTVCGDAFNDNAAKVVCRQLGDRTQVAGYVLPYTESSTRAISLENLRCGGHERSLEDCIHNAVGIHDCHRDVTVICGRREVSRQTKSPVTVTSVVPDYSVRLVSGTGPRGRVEVFISGHWGTVCDDGFTKKAARIVCSELGYSGYAIIDNSYVAETTVGALYEVRCDGHENSLRYCNIVMMGPNDCTSSMSVVVDCLNRREKIASIVGPVVGSLAGVVILTMIRCYCRKKSKHRARERNVRSQDGRQSQTLHYYTFGSWRAPPPSAGRPRRFRAPPSLAGGPRRVIVPPSSPDGPRRVIVPPSPPDGPRRVFAPPSSAGGPRRVFAPPSSAGGPRRVIVPPSSPDGPRRVIVPPASPGIYDGPPSYDKLFPNVVTPVPKSTDDSSPPPYPGTTSSAVFTVPTGSISTHPPYPWTTSPAQ